MCPRSQAVYSQARNPGLLAFPLPHRQALQQQLSSLHVSLQPLAKTLFGVFAHLTPRVGQQSRCTCDHTPPAGVHWIRGSHLTHQANQMFFLPIFGVRNKEILIQSELVSLR